MNPYERRLVAVCLINLATVIVTAMMVTAAFLISDLGYGLGPAWAVAVVALLALAVLVLGVNLAHGLAEANDRLREGNHDPR